MRIDHRFSGLLLAFALVATGAGLGPVQARGPFDGAWAVTILTERGSCDPAYRYAVVVADGTITPDARESSGVVAISGKVDGRGQVRVNLSRGDQSANGSGTLTTAGGAGTWSGKSSSVACTGRWEARRH
jgi:hypothetical protein